MKKIVCTILCAILILSCSACDLAKDIFTKSVSITDAEKVFEHEDFSITLTTGFLTMDFISEDFSFIWGDGIITVMGMEAGIGVDEITLSEYAEFFSQNLDGVNSVKTDTLDNTIPCVEYSVDNDGEMYSYLTCFYEAKDDIWIILFGAPESDYTKNYESICKYARSAKVSK